jgi:hypothetical protein
VISTLTGASNSSSSLGEMLQWASRRVTEVPLVDGDYFFISAFLTDSCETSSPSDTSHPGAPVGDTSVHGSR